MNPRLRTRHGVLFAGLLLAGGAFDAAAQTRVASAGAHRPAISVIIDDVGNLRPEGLRAIELPGPLTYAFLPHTPYVPGLARLAFQLDKEVLLHLPMQAENGEPLGPGGLTSGMDRATFDKTVANALAVVPHARGVNNHMGSLLTRKREPMRWLMKFVHTRPGLFFVDSRTASNSVAEAMARATGVATIGRDVFLDNDLQLGAIRARFLELVALAKHKGTAVGIGHPHSQTLEVLGDVLDHLDRFGVELVPVSVLIARRNAAQLRVSGFEFRVETPKLKTRSRATE